MTELKMTRVNRLLLSLALLLPAIGLQAQQTESAEPEPPPNYQIELLIFERPGEALEEHWPFDPGLPDPEQAVGSLSQPVSGPLTLLAEDQATLQAAAYALKTRGLPPLLHLVWQQPVENRDQARGLWLEEERLGGLIKISLGRYLHLDLDLLLTDQNTGEVYRIVDHRRMRSEQLHHLDHPKLGVLALITPVQLVPEETPPEASSPAETSPKPAQENAFTPDGNPRPQ